ncbi:MAG: flavodoxin family protein [Bacillota bacterium]
MKKILILDGSLRAGQTKRAIGILVGMLGPDYECEVINLRALDLGSCIGCAACLQRGEEKCPKANDGRDGLLAKLDGADGIVFASSNVALQVTHIFKTFFERFAFVFHRPRFFKKVFTGIITQGVYGGKKIDDYFKTTAGFWGGTYVRGAVLTLASGAYEAGKEWEEGEAAVAKRKLESLAKRFKKSLARQEDVRPSAFRVFMFRLTRTSHKYGTEDNRDYEHFRQQGWLDSSYYYPVDLGPIKSLIGGLADFWARKLIFKR